MRKNNKVSNANMVRVRACGVKTGWVFKSGKLSQVHCVTTNEFTLCGKRPPLSDNWVTSKIPMSVGGKSNLCPDCLKQIGSVTAFRVMSWDPDVFDHLADARVCVALSDPKKNRLLNRKFYDGKKVTENYIGIEGVEKKTRG